VIRSAAGFLMVWCLAACGSDVSGSPLVGDTEIIQDGLPSALTNTFGKAERGEVLFVDRNGGHCVLCHQVDGLEAPFQGNVGPTLTGVGDRLSSAQIRLRIVDYEQVRPGTLMPSYYRTHDLYQVGETFRGDPILSAQDVENLVAYLDSLKG